MKLATPCVAAKALGRLSTSDAAAWGRRVQTAQSQCLVNGPHLAAALQVAAGSIVAWLAQRRPHFYHH